MSAADQSTEIDGRPLIDQVYQELRLAAAAIRHERPDHTLQPTALANEAYIRLRRYLGDEPTARSDFPRLAALTVRNVLLDHARRHNARRRGAMRMCSGPMSSENEITTGAEMPVDIIALNRALNRLSKLDPRKNDVVHLRYFCGMTIEQIAACLGVSPRTVAH